MTVSELMDKLKTVPGDWRVMLDNESWGADVTDVLEELDHQQIVLTYK